MTKNGMRALLHLNVKAVARAFRVSDKTLTQLETFISKVDEDKARKLAEYYADLGVKCGNAGAELIRPADPLVLTAAGCANPGAVIDNLLAALRHVGGLATNLKRMNRVTASSYDTIEMQFPIVTGDLVHKILRKYVEEEKGLAGVYPDGGTVKGDALRDYTRIRPASLDHPAHSVRRPCQLFRRQGRLRPPAPNHTTKSHLSHQPRHRTSGHRKALPVERTPYLAHPVHSEILLPHPRDLRP